MKPVGTGGGVEQIIALRQQIMQRNDALQQLQNADSTPKTDAAPAKAPDFSETLSNALDGVNAAQKRSSDMAAAYERGEVTDIAQVMLARQESSVAFEATLQVRNRLLSAYQEIMRMGV
ncbi:flagellar hook-basal body complex protein FliE [Erythrobacter sp. W53]|uniref:flagellar hook-basal body complex protein FliE n=1 Tax=Erythrobacter sp. W53 TaxID=3425947 RepID=UPI003D7673B3